MTIALPSVPFAGLIVDFVSGTASMAILLTGLLAGGFRTFAVLERQPAERVEWHTAVGFLSGVAFSAAVIALDVALS